MRQQVSVMVEPLVPVSEVARYLLRITPNIDERYLAYCHELVGATICGKTSSERSIVSAFEILVSDLPLPIHTITHESSGETKKVLLCVRDYLVISPATQVPSMLEFRAALSKLHAICGY